MGIIHGLEKVGSDETRVGPMDRPLKGPYSISVIPSSYRSREGNGVPTFSQDLGTFEPRDQSLEAQVLSPELQTP